MLIGLRGFAGAGKNTVADILTEEFGFQQCAFAKQLKDLAYKLNPTVSYTLNITTDREVEAKPEINYTKLASVVDQVGWDDAKAWPEIREFLQNLGSGIRDIDPDFWVYSLELPVAENIVITDVRHDNEVMFVEHSGGTVYNVTRPNVGPLNSHISETALMGKYHDEIINDGTVQQLRVKLIKMFADKASK